MPPDVGVEMPGAMTDGSKRQRGFESAAADQDFEVVGSSQTPVRPQPKPRGSPGRKGPCVHEDVVEFHSMPASEMFPGVPDERLDQLCVLPAGVETFRRWSQTLFGFGQYKKIRTYGSAFQELPDYHKWTMEHIKNGKSSPQALDWRKFLEAAKGIEERLYPERKRVTYEGTDIEREFA